MSIVGPSAKQCDESPTKYLKKLSDLDIDAAGGHHGSVVLYIWEERQRKKVTYHRCVSSKLVTALSRDGVSFG